MWFRKPKASPADVARDLRTQALTVAAADVNVTPGPGHERIWGLLMETRYPEAVATLASFADGSTSLYFSSGGGIVGAGEHASVRTAAEQFLAIANAHVGDFAPTSAHPLPADGRVRFYARAFDGVLTAEAGEQDFGLGKHALSPVFLAGHAVIAAIRGTGAA